MAPASRSSNLGQLSGRVDDWVYRRVNGQTVVSRRPQARGKIAATAAQATQRDKFSAAIAYAKRILNDPWHLRTYQVLARAQNRRFDKLLVSDFLTPPTVEEIDVSDYQRVPGSRLTILAHDDVEVVSVRVTIRTAEGTLIEEGAAQKEHEIWRYRATATAPAGALALTAVAIDRPGHEGTLTIVHP